MTLFLIWSVCFSVLLTVNASAEYIDPSAVTYTAQAIAAVVVAIGALAAVFRHRITAFFRKDKNGSGKREIHMKDDAEFGSEDEEKQDP